jgi:hypothetical protein
MGADFTINLSSSENGHDRQEQNNVSSDDNSNSRKEILEIRGQRCRCSYRLRWSGEYYLRVYQIIEEGRSTCNCWFVRK